MKMEFQALSLAPEIKKTPLYYRFSYRDNQTDRRSFSRQDSLIWSLQKIFEAEFPRIGTDIRDVAINIIVNELEIDHMNLTMLVAATLTVYVLRVNREQLTPETFNRYYTMLSSVIEKDIHTKKGEETQSKRLEDIQILQVKFRATFYRYLVYVLTNSRDFTQ